MNTISVSELIRHQLKISSGDISFVYLEERNNRYRNRFFNNNYTVSFVLNGQKEIFGTTGSTIVEQGQGLLIPAGNSIVSEHSLSAKGYSRILIIFPRNLIQDFLSQHHLSNQQKKNKRF